MGILEMGSGALQSIKNKTNNISETSRVKNAINEENNRINEYYNRLGRLYAQFYSENPDERFADTINALKQSVHRVEEYQKQLKVLSGIMTCPNCHGDVPAGSTFCTTCGRPLPLAQPMQAAPAAPATSCPQCGSLIMSGSRFCTTCGYAVAAPVSPVNQQPVQPASPVYQQPAQPVAPVASAGEKICPSCGSPVESDFAFCTVCGSKVD